MNTPERKAESTFEEAVRQQRIRCGEFDVPQAELDQVFEVAEGILADSYPGMIEERDDHDDDRRNA